jgi:hypothetical protein
MRISVLLDLAADDIPGCFDELLLVSAVMFAGVGKAPRKAKSQSLRLLPRKRSREIQREIMRQDTVLNLGLGPGDRFMCLRQFLHVVDADTKRIMIDLRRLDLEHVQNYLRILGVILVPAVVQGLSGSGERQRRPSRISKPASARRHATGR